MKSMIPHLRAAMIMSSAKANDFVARHFPSHCPFIMLAEFPRSGVNWVRDLLGDCLQLPVPRHPLFPVTFPAILQTHSPDPIRSAPVAYVLRDGRDVFVSHFWHAMAAVEGGTASRRRVLKYHPSLAEDHGGTQRRMVRFYDEWRLRPVGTSASWGKHVRNWLAPDDGAAATIIRFEALKQDPRSALRETIAALGMPVPEDFVIDFAVERNAIERQKARATSRVDNLARTRRQGSAGGWRAEMPADLQARFAEDFGRELALAGYPED